MSAPSADAIRQARLFRPHRIAELDGLRGLACLAVVMAHCYIDIIVIPPGSALAPLRRAVQDLAIGGVDLFFVLSGFLISGVLMDGRDRPCYFQRFWTRRAARILPVLYLLLLSFVIARALWLRFHFTAWDQFLMVGPSPPVWTYATFVQSFPLALEASPAGYGGPQWLGITWSLAIEEQFYLLFPFAVFLLSRRNLLALALGCILAAPLLRGALQHLFHHWFAAYVLLPSRVDALMFGVVVAIIVRNPGALAQFVKWRYAIDAFIVVALLVLLGVFGASFHRGHYTIMAAMFAAAILRVFLDGKANRYNALLRNRILCFFGMISYALYMFHQPVNGIVHAYLFESAPRIASFSQFAAAIAIVLIATALATLSFHVVERPIRRMAHRWSESFGNSTMARRSWA